MYETVRERIRTARAAGTELEAFLASKPLADLDAKWASGFIKGDAFARTVWQQLD